MFIEFLNCDQKTLTAYAVGLVFGFLIAFLYPKHRKE